MKKQVCALLLSASLLCTAPAYAYETELANHTERTIVADGVTYEQIERLTDKGWINIHVTRVDMTHAELEPTVLIPEHISDKAPLSALAAREPGTIAAINGDFFDPAGKSTLGMIVKDGHFVTTGIHDNRFYTLAMLNDGNMHLMQPTSESMAVSNGSHTLSIQYKNKPYAAWDRAILLDYAWDQYSIGNTADEPVVEVVVSGGHITDIRDNMSPVAIPSDGYVITAVGTKRQEVLDHFQVGDTLSYRNSPYLNLVQDAIGGGAAIVKNGEPLSDFSLAVAGRHPRTAVGFSKDRKQMILVTIDGRHSDYTGVTQSELAWILHELGAWDAINMDGGGSSEMMVRNGMTQQLDIVNTPSDGGERRIHNGLGIVSTQTDTSTISRIEWVEKQDVAVVGMPVSVEAAGFNSAGLRVDRSIPVTYSGVNGAVTDQGFIPSESGLLEITAQVGRISKTAYVQVEPAFNQLAFNHETLQLAEGEKVALSVAGVTARGYRFPIPADTLSWIVPSELGVLDSSGKYEAGAAGVSGFIRAAYGSAEAYLPVAVGMTTTPLHSFEAGAVSFNAWPSEVNGAYQEIPFATEGEMGGQLLYDFRTTNATRAVYATFGDQGLTLPAGSVELKLDLFGTYGNGHWLRGNIQDASGETYTIDFTRHVDWEGWQNVSAALPRHAKGPLQLTRIYLVEPDRTIKDAGTIVMDNLQVVQQALPPESPQSDQDPFIDPKGIGKGIAVGAESFEKLQKYQKFLDLANEAGIYAVHAEELPYTVMTFQNGNGRLQTEEWEKLLALQATGRPIVLMLEAAPVFKKAPSQRLFNQTVESLAADHPVLVAYPDSRTFMKRQNGYYVAGYSISPTDALWISYQDGFLYTVESE